MRICQVWPETQPTAMHGALARHDSACTARVPLADGWKACACQLAPFHTADWPVPTLMQLVRFWQEIANRPTCGAGAKRHAEGR